MLLARRLRFSVFIFSSFTCHPSPFIFFRPLYKPFPRRSHCYPLGQLLVPLPASSAVLGRQRKGSDSNPAGVRRRRWSLGNGRGDFSIHLCGSTSALLARVEARCRRCFGAAPPLQMRPTTFGQLRASARPQMRGRRRQRERELTPSTHVNVVVEIVHSLH